jgi:lactoylglutathione lyase
VPQADTRHGPYAKFSLPGGGAIALQARDHFESTAQPLRPGGGDHGLIAIRVASVDAEAARLRAAGATVDDPRDLFGRMRAAWLRDPAGTLIELQEWLTASHS